MTPLLRYRLLALFLLASSTFAIAQDDARPQQFQISADKLAAFVGQYQYDDDPDVIRSLSVDSSRLFVESVRAPRAELVPQSEDTFSLANVSVHVTLKFIRSTEGKIVGFNRTVEDDISHARKINDQ